MTNLQDFKDTHEAVIKMLDEICDKGDDEVCKKFEIIYDDENESVEVFMNKFFNTFCDRLITPITKKGIKMLKRELKTKEKNDVKG